MSDNVLNNFSLRLYAFLVFLIGCNVTAQAQAPEKIVVHNRILVNDYNKHSLSNILKLSRSAYGDYELVSSADMEHDPAFQALVAGNIDIFIGSINSEREKLVNTIYVPIDRGLKGFRICIVHKDTPKFLSIRNVSQFVERNLSVGLGEFWPDRLVYEQNGFKTITAPSIKELNLKLKNREYDCLNRSVNKLEIVLAEIGDPDFTVEQELVMIYPNADFISVPQSNVKLAERLAYGLELAIKNNSYYEIFDYHYGSALEDNKVYERKLIFMSRTDASKNIMQAINRYGISSFIMAKP